MNDFFNCLRVAIAIIMLGTLSNGGVAFSQPAIASASAAPQTLAERSWRPTYRSTPYPRVAASSDPAVIAEGQYLFWAVAQCPACHIPHEQMVFAAKDAMLKLLPSGGEEWDMGALGVIRSANITPTSRGLGAWTDREVARAVKYAVSRDGRPIFFMNGLGYIDDRDLYALVSYLRTISPVSRNPKPTEITAKGIGTMKAEMQGWLKPRPQVPVPYAARGAVSVRRGAYLANGPARCIHCHSDVSDSPRVALRGAPFAGSLWAEPDRDDPSMEINAPNLTPSKNFGIIYAWGEQIFVARIKAGRALKNSPMPWEDFRLMSDEDLASIYRYLKSLAPVDRNVGPSYRKSGWKSEPSS